MLKINLAKDICLTIRGMGSTVLAARALAHLVEALPAAAANIVRADAVPTLCDKLVVTEFIDLKEQIILVRHLPVS